MKNKLPVMAPNAANGRCLCPEFYTDQIQYFESYVAALRPSVGLLPVGSKSKQPLVSLSAPNVIQLDAIHAVGERGHLLSTEQGDRINDIEPCDVRNLSSGCHQIFVCLAHEKVPCGEPVEVYPSDPASSDRAWVERHLRSRLCLAIDDERLKSRDWLQVAEVWRVREAGTMRTQLNDRFHPMITDIRAYCQPNPIPLFVQHILSLLEKLPDDPATTWLKTELSMLNMIAEEGSPPNIFLQTQRCLGYLGSLPEPLRCVGRTLSNYRYSSETFCDFLASLLDLCSCERQERFPEILRIDGQSYYRLLGEVNEIDEFWEWRPNRAGFVANSVAVYLPAAQPGTVPHVRFGQHARNESQFPVARHAKIISGPGSAIVMDQFSGEITSLILAVDAIGLQQRLRMQLGEGHAIYYC